jgi:hypothetical protein
MKLQIMSKKMKDMSNNELVQKRNFGKRKKTK